MALYVYIESVMETTMNAGETLVTLTTTVRNKWDLTTEEFHAMGVGAVATFEKDGRWIAQVVVAPNYSMGSRNDFATEAEAIDSVRKRAHYAHGYVLR